MALTRWVREVSEQQLMVAAQAKMARRNGLVHSPPKGTNLFWQKVYAPIFYRLPVAFRNKVAAAMPGSHRQTWHKPAQADGPAASVTRSWTDAAGATAVSPSAASSDTTT